MTHPMLRRWPLLAALATLAAGTPAWAENRLTIDDFSSGHFQAKPLKKGRVTSTQAGAMLGGQRSTTLFVCDTTCASLNPYNQGVSYGYDADRAPAGDNAFVQATPAFTYPRIDQGYGPMHANLAAYDRIRVNFLGLTQPLNFDLQLFSGAGRGTNGCNLPPLNQAFSVELPFANFSMQGGGFVPSDITDMNFIYQNGSVIGGVEYAVHSIEASDTPAPGAIVCHLP